MELDFSALDSISGGTQKQGMGGGARHELQRQADANADERARAAAIYAEYQRNVKTSEALRAEILKGENAGEDVGILFLKAAKAISLMTGDSGFYTQIERLEAARSRQDGANGKLSHPTAKTA